VLQPRTLMTCWRIDDVESHKAWDEYIEDGKGVAIQSTYGRFKGCLEEKGYRVYAGVLRKPNQWPEENSIFIEKVVYRGRDSDIIGNRTPYEYLRLYTRKGLCYEWENELRAFLISPNEVNDYGCHIPINLANLVETIYVSPKVQNLRAKVKTLTSKYGLNTEVKDSQLGVIFRGIDETL